MFFSCEEAKRHSSGWAMRNTNNHNVRMSGKESRIQGLLLNITIAGEYLEEILPWSSCLHQTLCSSQRGCGKVISIILIISTSRICTMIISTIIITNQVTIRPAICDKARKKQQGKPCPNPACQGVLETRVGKMMTMYA